MNDRAHLCLVSVQATPNLTPVLDPATKPTRVILLTSPDMQRRADWLEAVLRSRGVGVERWGIDDAWDVEHIQFRVLELLERSSDLVQAKAVALNATGGTKPMSIAAYEVFRTYDLPIFYVHPERDRLVWLHPTGQPPQELDNRLKLEPFLLAHGARVEGIARTGISPPLSRLTDWLVGRVASFGHALGILNYLAMQAESGLVSPEMDVGLRRNQRLQALIDRFTAAGLLAVRGHRLSFPDEDARFYVNGGWLEEHVYNLLRGLRRELPQIQDLARSVDIVRETPRGDAVRNEIDVACLAENRLRLIECKTRTFSGQGMAGHGANALYRLDTLSDLLGGLQARAMLISYRPLPHAVRRRAADLHIHVCAGPRLPELAADLRAWLP